MWQTNKLIKKIRDSLTAHGSDAALEELAVEYARLAQEANARLESCAAMIEKGSEYQALQLAEAEPVLLDLLAALSFAEAREWSALCAARGLPVAARFDPRAVQALDALYAKGIRTDHPLYRDYRAAVSSRDDAHAIQIVRSIVRLNPQDANARAELARLENKLFQLRLQSLRAALAGRDAQNILAELAELERLATPAKLAEHPEFTQAAEIRRQAAREEAIELVEQLAASLEEERAAESWRMLGERLTRIRALQEEFDLTLSAPAAAAIAKVQPYFEERREAAELDARYADAVQSAQEAAEQMAARIQEPPPLTLRDADALSREFTGRWRAVEEFARPIPETVATRARTAAAALNSEVARLQKRRRLRLATTITVALAAMGVAAWFALREFYARKYSQQLVEFQAAGKVQMLDELIAQLRGPRAGLLANGELRARLESGESWLQEERDRLARIESALVAMERAASGSFSDTDPVAIHAQMESVQREISELTTETGHSPARRLASLQESFGRMLSTARESLATRADQEISALEAIARDRLGLEQPKPTLIAAVDEIVPRLKELEARAHSSLEALTLAPELESRMKALRQRVDEFASEIALLRRIHEDLLRAATIEDFQAALEGFKEAKLQQLAEVNAARKMIANFPKSDDVLAGLLMPGDPAGWAAAKVAAGTEQFTPADVQASEITRLLALRDDRYLNDIWEVTYVDRTKNGVRRSVYSRGEMQKVGPREVGGSQVTQWTGAVFDPSIQSEMPAFVPLNLTSQRSSFGLGGSGEVTASAQSAATQTLARLELNRVTDDAGEKFERPLLRVFDDLVREKSAGPLFKAHLMQQLAGMLHERPTAWGLQYCPRLARDLQRLEELCGGEVIRSMDWMLERKRAQFGPKLTPFFAELQNRTYLAEARVHREVVQAALAAGLRFGGFVDGEGRPRVLGEAAAADARWCVDGSGGVMRCDEEAKGAARFSPIFYVPLNRQTVLTEAMRKTGTKSIVPEVPFFANL